MNCLQRLYIRILMKSSKWNCEHRFIGGKKNSDKTFYVIRRSGMKLGLFSIFNTTLGRIKYAYDNNMIPVVDMQFFMNCFLDDSEYGKKNAWEFYFEQPSGYSLEEIYKSKNIILSESEIPNEGPNDSMEFLCNQDGQLDYWRDICQKNIRLKKDVSKIVDKEYQTLISPEDKVLGVLARGTDYMKLKPAHHPVQPEIDDIINKSKEVMEQLCCNKIFLATEDINIVAKFRVAFGDRMITNNQCYVQYKGGYISENYSTRDNDKYKRGLEYLTTIVILSRCNCIVAGRTSGTVGASLLSKGWEYSYFFDYGNYE